MSATNIFQPDPWFNGMVLIDGMPRSGKSLIASAFSSMPPFEPWQIPISVDHVVKYLELGMFTTEAAQAALLISLNSSTFDYAVGRGLNRRVFDQSSIFNTYVEPSLNARENEGEYGALMANSKATRSTPVIVTHENINYLSLWFEAVNRLNVIEVIRNPASLMVSWQKRSIVERWGNDPLMFVPCLEVKGSAVPLYAKGHLAEWLESDSLERLVLSAEIQYKEIFSCMQNKSLTQTKRLHFVQIEQFKLDPIEIMTQLLAGLGEPLPIREFAKFCAVEDLPRDSMKVQIEADKGYLKNLLPKGLHSRLESLLEEYRENVKSSI